LGRTVSVLLLAVVAIGFASGSSGAQNPEYPETKQLVARVKKAAALVKSQGEAAFPAFRVKGSEWFQGDHYIIVGEMSGVNVCHPAQPEYEGQNQIDLKDANGKLIYQSFIRTASSKEKAGWVHYMWPRPGGSEPSWKSTYVVRAKAPSGTEYVVASGIYPTHNERSFVVTTVDNATRLLRKEGKAGFAALRDKSGDFLFGDVYVFVNDFTGSSIVNPPSPQLEGQNLIDLKDARGKLLIRDMVRALETRDSAWVEYMWPKPGESQPSRKSSYIRKVDVDGQLFIVGAGTYLDYR
jgi:signal transduction histidine kinase